MSRPDALLVWLTEALAWAVVGIGGAAILLALFWASAVLINVGLTHVLKRTGQWEAFVRVYRAKLQAEANAREERRLEDEEV